MIENLIRETSLRFLNLLGEQSEQLKELIADTEIELIDEAIEILTDETLRNFDEYVSSLEEVESDE